MEHEPKEKLPRKATFECVLSREEGGLKMAEKEFKVDVDTMLAMQVERASMLSEYGTEQMKGVRPIGVPSEVAIRTGVFALECLKAANTIERGVLEDYHNTRDIGVDNSPDLQMVAEYLAEYHMDEIKDDQTVGQVAVQVINDLKEQLNAIRRKEGLTTKLTKV